MKKIRMGVIGTGNIAGLHIGGILSNTSAELTALCDVNEKALKAAAKLHNIPKTYCFNDYIELLNCSDIDAVSICTPNSSHYEIARQAIISKKPFALEKPIALNYIEAKKLQELTEKADIPNMVCFSYRFTAAIRYARWLVQNNYLGKIHHINTQYVNSASLASKQRPLDWRFSKEISGSGALGDLGSHMIDITRFIIGEFKSVCGHSGTFVKKRKLQDSEEYGNVNVDDYCNFMAEVDDGVPATFGVSRFAFGRFDFQRVEIFGEKGGLIYTSYRRETDNDVLEVCIGKVDGDATTYHKISVPQSFEADQMGSFFDIVNGKDDGLAATVSDGCITQKIIDSVIESSENRKWIILDKE